MINKLRSILWPPILQKKEWPSEYGSKNECRSNKKESCSHFQNFHTRAPLIDIKNAMLTNAMPTEK